MLSGPDARIVERDRSLPGLGVVLDGDAFAEQLHCRVPLIGIRSATPAYVRYKPFTSCLVAYRLRTVSGEFTVYAKAFRGSAADKLANARSRQFVEESLGLGKVALDRRAVVVWAFPNDDKLRILRVWNDEQRRVRLVRRIVPHTRIGSNALQLLRYKPERRVVACVDRLDGRRIVIRACLPGDFAQSVTGAGAFASRGPLRIAERLGASSRDNALAVEWLPGGGLSIALADPNVDCGILETVGTALAQLHDQRGEDLRVKTYGDELRRLTAAAEAVAVLCPEIAGRTMTLLSRIAGGLQATEQRPIHGDFHAKQVVLDRGYVGFIDFDEAAIADPMLDVATLIAHFNRDYLAGQISTRSMEEWCEGFLNGYRRASSLNLDGLPAYIAGGLLALAPHPFRDREPHWFERTEMIVARAREILDRTPSTRVPAGGTTVVDRFRVTDDPSFPFAGEALTPITAQGHLMRMPSLNERRPFTIERIEVIRYRAHRRCVIAYTIGRNREDTLKIIGKMHHRRTDAQTFQTLALLRAHGFADDSSDGISVPEPLGTVPELRMWIQACVAGTPATELLADAAGPHLAKRISEAVCKLHRSPVRVSRRHTIDDELAILKRRLSEVSASQPPYEDRLGRLFAACESIATTGRSGAETLIHRDFYPDQVLVNGNRVWLLDLDLCSMGDPALDAGNFLAHVIEQGLRTGRADTFGRAAHEFREGFLELSGRHYSTAVDVHTTLSLARHIWISTQFAPRRRYTERLISMTEARLGLSADARFALSEAIS